MNHKIILTTFKNCLKQNYEGRFLNVLVIEN